MNRSQWVLLNVLGVLLAVFIITDIFLARENQRLARDVNEFQSKLNSGRQAEVVLRQLALKMAQNADLDPEMRKLLVKHQLKATIVVDGKKKEYP